MYEQMRREDRKIEEREMEEILKKAEYGILSTISEDMTPYAIPVNFVYIEKKIYFHCAKGVGHKLKNIKNKPHVCFTVVGETTVLEAQFAMLYESVVAFGTAKEVEVEKKEILKKILEKYSSSYMQEGMVYLEGTAEKAAVYEIEVEHMSGKARKK